VRLESGQLDRVATLPGVDRVDPESESSASFFVRDSDEFVISLVRSGIEFRGLTVRGATLEEAFLSLTGGARAAAGFRAAVRTTSSFPGEEF